MEKFVMIMTQWRACFASQCFKAKYQVISDILLQRLPCLNSPLAISTQFQSIPGSPLVSLKRCHKKLLNSKQAPGLNRVTTRFERIFLSLLQQLHVHYLGENLKPSLSEVDNAFRWQLVLIESTQLESVMSHKTQWSGKVVLTWQLKI